MTVWSACPASTIRAVTCRTRRTSRSKCLVGVRMGQVCIGGIEKLLTLTAGTILHRATLADEVAQS